MPDTQEVGFVRYIQNFLIRVDGLPTVKINEMVETQDGLRGWVSALLPDAVEILMLDEHQASPGEMFHRSGKSLKLEVGEFLLGRAINPLGVPIDSKGLLAKNNSPETLDLDGPAVGIDKRQFIKKQFDTGVTAVDTLVPIGKGQRQLVIGDGHSGKSEFLVDTIVNQKDKNVICIYAMIGKPISEVRDLLNTIEQNGSLPYTVIIAASSTDITPLIFLTPHAALTVAEYFQRQGKDVLVILDDLGNHAKIYREMSLLSNKAPGRESYPGDIFYQHAHLMERAGNFNKSAGDGSITLFPVIEINLSDFTTFIPTNIISMTDGHIFFRASLFNQGQRPAIDISASVSRVGRQTQERIQNELASRTKQILSQASQLETLSRFSAELPIETQLVLRRKDIITEFIRQEATVNAPKQLQVALLSLAFTKFVPAKESSNIKKNRKVVLDFFATDPDAVALVKDVFNFTKLDDFIVKLDALMPKLEKIWQQ